MNNDTTSRQAIQAAFANFANIWVPASNGTETPFNTRTGKRLLYCYNPSLGRHAYLDLGSDMILTDDEAFTALGLY